MPIAGLVLTLADDDALQRVAVEALTADARLSMGEMQGGGRLPVVTDTTSITEEQDLWNEIARTPGVLLVDLAFHDGSDLEAFTSDDLPSRWRRAAEG